MKRVPSARLPAACSKNAERANSSAELAGNELFESSSKFESHCGWPSFTHPDEQQNVRLLADHSHGMNRVEVRCQQCDSHLGHVFEDGPEPRGTRYCINSLSLKFIPSNS